MTTSFVHHDGAGTRFRQQAGFILKQEHINTFLEDAPCIKQPLHPVCLLTQTPVWASTRWLCHSQQSQPLLSSYLPLAVWFSAACRRVIHTVQSGSFMFPWLYSTAWLWLMAQAVRFRCTDSEWEASTRAARVAWRASSVMASDAALLPGQSELIWIRGSKCLDGIVPSSHQTHEGNYTNSWTFSAFVQYVSAGMTTKQMKLFIAGYKSHDIMRSTPHWM